MQNKVVDYSDGDFLKRNKNLIYKQQKFLKQ